MRNLRANIEFGGQVAIAIAVLVAAGVLVQRSFFARQVEPVDLPRINAGERLNLPSVDWKRNKKTLVFFLEKDCASCTSNAALYRQLIEEASKRNVVSLAFLPNSPDETNKYLEHLELPIKNVHTGALSSYKMPETPTVLIVDSEGIVRSAWFGAEPGHDKQMRDKVLELSDAKTTNGPGKPNVRWSSHTKDRSIR